MSTYIAAPFSVRVTKNGVVGNFTISNARITGSGSSDNGDWVLQLTTKELGTNIKAATLKLRTSDAKLFPPGWSATDPIAYRFKLGAEQLIQETFDPQGTDPAEVSSPLHWSMQH